MYLSSFQNTPPYVINQKACESFDRFIDGRAVAHNSYDWEMIKYCDFEVKHVGFLNKQSEFFTTSTNEIILFEINPEFDDAGVVSKKPFPAGLSSFSQNMHCKEMFIAASNSSISILNVYTNEAVKIPISGPQKHVTWVGKAAFAITDASGAIVIYDIEAQKVAQTTKAFSMKEINKIISHPTEPFMLLASNNNIQFIDTRQKGAALCLAVNDGITAIDWMPDDNSGVIVGFSDGILSLFSLADSRSVCSQSIATSPISSISFSPSKRGYAMIACETDILFANLKIWGYGRMTISKTHQGHVGNVIDAQWWNGPEVRIISCDDKNVINMFQLSDTYLPNITMPSI
jgi:WD40 repeat protein